MRGIVDTPERASELRKAITLLFEVSENLDREGFVIQPPAGPPLNILEKCEATKDLGTSRSAIVSALTSRAATTTKSIVALIDIGHGTDALVLARNLFETAVTIVWIMKDRYVRAYLFALSFAAARKHLADTWPQFFPQHGPMYRDDYVRLRDDAVCAAFFPNLRSTAWARRFEPDGTMSGTTIGVKGMLKELEEGEKDFGGLRYDLEYFALSTEAHSQAMSLFQSAKWIDREGRQVFSPQKDRYGQYDGLFHAALNFYWILVTVNAVYYGGQDEQLAEAKLLIDRREGAMPEKVEAQSQTASL